MVYARLASGYRAGGPNTAPGVPRMFSPDTTQNYEIGTKGDFLNHKVTVDASLYYVDWKDIQLFVFDPQNYQGYTANAGRAKSQGVELSVKTRPATGLTITGWIALNDAKLTEPFPSTIPGTSTFGAPGDRLPNSARVSGNVSLEQKFPIWSGGTGFVGGAVSYVGDRKGSFTSTNLRQDLPAYTQVDLLAGTRHGSWLGTFYINNLTDKRAAISGGLGGFPADAFQYIQPRTFGLTVSKSF
jgi:iron complex outermembrane recepter protein